MRTFIALLLNASVALAGPGDGSWNANTGLTGVREITDHEVGNAQGATVLNGKVYVYGDVNNKVPRIGVIKEYDLNLKPTGRLLRLTQNGEPLIIHPTGLTHDPLYGTFLGDTMNRKSNIYRLDWERAWQDGNLDNAVLDVMKDDAAVNGGRPLFVKLGGKTLLATSDYGDLTPQLRLYDPAALLREKSSLAPGVMVHKIPAGAFTQNMTWDNRNGNLTFIQNVVGGKGWQLDTVNLQKAIDAGGIESPGVRVQKQVFPRHDELEGMVHLPGGEDVFILGGHNHSMTVGKLVAIPPMHSPIGDTRYSSHFEPIGQLQCDATYRKLTHEKALLEAVGI